MVRRLLEDEGKDVAKSIDAEVAAESKLGGLRRKTEADEKNDQKSLERALDRTLYLLVKKKRVGKVDRWEFPDGPIEGEEGVKEVCESALFQILLLTTTSVRCAHSGFNMWRQYEYVVCWEPSCRPPSQGACESRR